MISKGIAIFIFAAFATFLLCSSYIKHLCITLICTLDFRENSMVCPIDKDPISTKQIFKDKARHFEIINHPCLCANRLFGCEWNGIVADLEKHMSICIFHAARCIYCDQELIFREMKEHFYSCQRIQNEDGSCTYHAEGCRHKTSSTMEAVQHLKEDVFMHIELSYSFLFAENQSLKKEVNEMRRKCDTATEQIQILNHKFSAIMIEVQQRLSSVSEPTDNNKKQSVDMPGKPEFEKLSTKCSLLSRNLSDLDLRQQIFENVTLDGRIIWKIDNFNIRYQQAITGRVTALHSAPGFTAKYGYKFCGRLYLNGDGMGKCTHASLFFVLMKSEYDNLLEWPFHQQVIFRLINQENPDRSVHERFVSDRNSSSFQKPVKAMNVAAGCPMFISKEELMNGGFVLENAMFVEIIVSKLF